jgi:hypothetical protein
MSCLTRHIYEFDAVGKRLWSVRKRGQRAELQTQPFAGVTAREKPVNLLQAGARAIEVRSERVLP